MNNKKFLLIGLVILVVLSIVWFIDKKISEESYSIVYLTTGEVYIGKLKTFPRFELRDGYILQIIKDANDPNKSSFQLNPINEALWAPKALYLIKKNIIFYGPLSENSKISETLKNRN